MKVEKTIIDNNDVIPFIAALPYQIECEETEINSITNYDPNLQISINAGGRGSYCTYDDSIGGYALSSKSDTKKDD